MNRPLFSSLRLTGSLSDKIEDAEAIECLEITIGCHLKSEKYIFKLTRSVKSLIYKFYLIREIFSKKMFINIFSEIHFRLWAVSMGDHMKPK